MLGTPKHIKSVWVSFVKNLDRVLVEHCYPCFGLNLTVAGHNDC